MQSWPKCLKSEDSSKLLEPGSFDTCKNAEAPIIAMLDCSEVNMKVSDTDMETADFNNCREVLRDNKDVNGVLAITRERARFSCKDRQKFIDLFAQLISELC